MRVYAENERGNHLFYVDIYNCEGYGNFIECSLPETIFNLPDIRALAREIFTVEYNTQKMLKQLDQLIFLLKSKKELTSYYFQPIELKVNGRFNSEQSNVMYELLLKQDLPNLQVVSLNSNPFLFRIICKELLAYDKSKLKTINRTSFNEPFLNSIQVLKSNSINDNHTIEYKAQEIKLHGLSGLLYIKYYGEHPCEFRFDFFRNHSMKALPFEQ